MEKWKKGRIGNYRVNGIGNLSVPRVWSVTLAHRQNQFLAGPSINHFTWYGPRGAIYRACRFASYAEHKYRWSELPSGDIISQNITSSNTRSIEPLFEPFPDDAMKFDISLSKWEIEIWEIFNERRTINL